MKQLSSKRIAISFGMLALALATVLAFAPAQAYANVQKSDVIAGETVANRNLSAAQCPSVEATSVLLMDSDGNVLFERNADEHVNIASITKVMTAVTAVEYASLDTEITVSSTAAAIGESSAGLQAGDTLTLQEALKAMLWPSGNDAAQSIAECVGAQILKEQGNASPTSTESVEAFVRAMNDTSAKLGMTNSLWANPHGLDDGVYASQEMYSTARDVATLANYAMKIDAIRSITSQEGGTVTVVRDGATTGVELESTDELFGVVDGVLGVKTGFTDAAGECFAGAVEQNGTRLISAVLNSTSSSMRFTDTRTLWEWAYENMIDYAAAQTTQTTVNANGTTVPLVAEVADAAWTDKTIPATLEDPNQTFRVFALAGNVSQEVTYYDINGGVKAGDVVGTITYYQQNEVIGTANLVATQDVAAPNPLEALGIWWSRLIGGFSGDDGVADSVCYNEVELIYDKSSLSAA